MTLKVGIIGIGYGQAVLLPAFRLDPRCEVVAICASQAERAAKVAEKLNIPRAVGDWRELVSDPQIAALAIATQPALQTEIAQAALAQGKHLFCEKPLAHDRTTALEMTQAAEQAKIANMVDFEFPEVAAWQQTKTILTGGGIGSLRHAAVSWNVETYANKMKLESWKTAAESGGTLNSFVSHTFYYLEWLLGPIVRLSARLLRAPDDFRSGDTLAALILELASGAAVTVSVSGAAFLGNGHRLEFYGDDGTLWLDNPTADYTRGFRVWHGTRQTNRLEDVTAPVVAAEGDGRIEAVGPLVRRFVDWAEGGAPQRPNFRDGLRVQQLLEAARQSDESRAWVELDER